MPELPEVEVVKRSLINKTQNLIVKAVKINDGRLRYKINRNKMLARALSSAFRGAARPSAQNMLLRTAQRGVYTNETRPHVFINEHTKVLVQGMTGKHVSTNIVAFKITHPHLFTTGNLPH